MTERPNRLWGRPSGEPILDVMESSAQFFDESSSPGFRAVYGELLREADDVCVALTRIRLASLDFSVRELGGLERVRLLLKEMNAVTLHAETAELLRSDRDAPGIVRLLNRLQEGQIDVRVLPLGRWYPSFSVFQREGHPHAVLTGVHRFSRESGGGPLFASVHGPAAAGRALERFETLWQRAHDIGPALDGLLQVAERSGHLATSNP